MLHVFVQSSRSVFWRRMRAPNAIDVVISVALLMIGFALAAPAAAIAGEADTANAEAVDEGADVEQLDLFLLVGQSNMAGRGKVTAEDRVIHDRVLMLDADDRWVPAVDPLHFDKPSVVGVGLGRTFGIEIAAAAPEATVGLIPCAVGGSPIDAWTPGTHYPPTDSHPWDDAIRRAKRALSDGKLRAILWHQGESDGNDSLSAAYQDKLIDLVARFRSELDAPEVPFIVGQLGQFAERPWSEGKAIIDEAHRRLPTLVPHTAFVSSDGLVHGGDQVHFDAESYRELGRRYAAAYRGLVPPPSETVQRVDFEVDLSVAHQGFDGERCWVHARAGIIPSSDASADPLAVMTTQPLLLTGSDVFYSLHTLTSPDRGNSWSAPVVASGFERQVRDDGIEIIVSDFTPKWHAASGRLLGIGHTVWYQDDRVMKVRPRATAYAVYDPDRENWATWKRLQLPAEKRFENAGAGSVQRVDLDSGEVLLPIYFKDPGSSRYGVTVLRCRFDGDTLGYVGQGNELSVPTGRGLYEPSLTRFGGRYYLTLRNDEAGYVAVSDDGLHFREPRRWTFDDGAELGNYNTQQHWVSHDNALYLVYTRRAEGNDHVFRHRAPLWIAQVDPWRLTILRDTERVLVAEAGARLGNFGVTEVSTDEVWVTAAEWMQPKGVERYGSDNRIFVAKIRW